MHASPAALGFHCCGVVRHLVQESEGADAPAVSGMRRPRVLSFAALSDDDEVDDGDVVVVEDDVVVVEEHAGGASARSGEPAAKRARMDAEAAADSDIAAAPAAASGGGAAVASAAEGAADDGAAAGSSVGSQGRLRHVSAAVTDLLQRAVFSGHVFAEEALDKTYKHLNKAPNRAAFLASDGVKLVMDVLAVHSRVLYVISAACGVVGWIATDDAATDALVQHGGVATLLRAGTCTDMGRAGDVRKALNALVAERPNVSTAVAAEGAAQLKAALLAKHRGAESSLAGLLWTWTWPRTTALRASLRLSMVTALQVLWVRCRHTHRLTRSHWWAAGRWRISPCTTTCQRGSSRRAALPQVMAVLDRCQWIDKLFSGVVSAALAVLGNMASNNATAAAKIEAAGGIRRIVTTMGTCTRPWEVVHACRALRNLAQHHQHCAAAIVDAKGVRGLLKALGADAAVAEAACGALANLAHHSAAARTAIAAPTSASRIIKALDQHASNLSVAEAGCTALCNVVRDAPDSCATLAVAGASGAVLHCLARHAAAAAADAASGADLERRAAARASIAETACFTVGRLALVPGQRAAILASTGAERLVKALAAHAGSAAVSQSACEALSLLANTEAAATAVMAAGGIPTVITACLKHAHDASVVAAACSALSCIAKAPGAAAAIRAGGGVEPLLGALQTHAASSTVVEVACSALCALAADADTRTTIVAVGGLGRLAAVRAAHWGTLSVLRVAAEAQAALEEP